MTTHMTVECNYASSLHSGIFEFHNFPYTKYITIFNFDSQIATYHYYITNFLVGHIFVEQTIAEGTENIAWN